MIQTALLAPQSGKIISIMAALKILRNINDVMVIRKFLSLSLSLPFHFLFFLSHFFFLSFTLLSFWFALFFSLYFFLFARIRNGNDDDEWDDYDNDDMIDNGSPGVPVRALYDYIGTEDDELTFKQGDEFEKLSEEDEQGWWVWICFGLHEIFVQFFFIF